MNFLTAAFLGSILGASAIVGAVESVAASARGAPSGVAKSELFQSTVGLKLLKTVVVSDLGYATLLENGETALPGASKTIKCPASTKCLITVEVRTAWSVQTVAGIGPLDVQNGQAQVALSNIFGHSISVDDVPIAADIGSGAFVGLDTSVNTAAMSRVNAGKHKVVVSAFVEDATQLLWNYSVIIRLYKR
jgi:hypothetical protein